MMRKVRKVYFQLLLVVLLVTACQQKQQSIRDRFTGRWVASYFIDSLSLSNISTIPFGATEISLPATDTITMWNEDVEGNWTYPTTWHGDTLVTLYDGKALDRILLLKDARLNDVVGQGQLVSTFRGVSVPYSKVDSSMVATADALGVTTVRLLVNRVLSQQSFTDAETKKVVQFEEDGRVSGLRDFVRYYVAIAGDDANINDCTSVTFFDAAGNRTKWGMKGKSGKVELYSLRLLTEPDEKPWYEADCIACNLTVN